VAVFVSRPDDAAVPSKKYTPGSSTRVEPEPTETDAYLGPGLWLGSAGMVGCSALSPLGAVTLIAAGVADDPYGSGGRWIGGIACSAIELSVDALEQFVVTDPAPMPPVPDVTYS